MDKSFPQQGSDTERSNSFFAGLQVVNRIRNWLPRLIQWMRLTEEEQTDAGVHLRQLTEEEQKDAGVYLADRRFE